jgi:AcrR family transcriptional regulator
VLIVLNIEKARRVSVLETKPQRHDRRIMRSRQALIEAFQGLLEEKEFSEISIYQISQRADLNRGTFYAHFSDKYELLELVIRDQFREYLDNELGHSSRRNQRNDLKSIIQVVINYFQESRCAIRPNAPLAYIVERALHHELEAILVRWLLQNSDMDNQKISMSPEMVASMMAWSIFGATSQLCSSKPIADPEELAAQVEMVIIHGVGSLSASAKL